MQIKITYTSMDGVRKARSFKTLAGARKFALDWVGPQDVEGGSYAVSNDGVGKVTWVGCTRAQLFGAAPAAPLNVETTFYAKGNELFCREKGYTHDHVGQLFARVVQVMDNITGDHVAGWMLRPVDSRVFLNEEHIYATREDALAGAKHDMLGYLDYLDAEEGTWNYRA